MSESQGSRGTVKIALGVVAIAVAVAALVVYFTSRPGQPEAGTVTNAEAGDSPRPKSKRRIIQDGGTPYKGSPNVPELLAKHAKWNPPRPLRFVVRYGHRSQKGFSKEDALSFAEAIRKRFADGEDSYKLIRENSDPPSGIPREVLKQWEDLTPTESSPVIPLEDGFAVFFGAPTERPAPRETEPDRED